MMSYYDANCALGSQQDLTFFQNAKG